MYPYPQIDHGGAFGLVWNMHRGKHWARLLRFQRSLRGHGPSSGFSFRMFFSQPALSHVFCMMVLSVSNGAAQAEVLCGVLGTRRPGASRRKHGHVQG